MFSTFPPFIGHDIRVIIKNVFRTFFRRFSSKHFLLALFCVSLKIVSRVFYPPFFGHDIRVIIKSVFSHFFPMISSHFLLAHFLRFCKNYFACFLTQIFWSRHSCEYKKSFFALFPEDFFPYIFCSHYSCVYGKMFSTFFSPNFLVTTFV